MDQELFDILRWRESEGLTQEMAARVLDVTDQAFNRWENNKGPVSKRTVMACLLYSNDQITYRKYGLDKWQDKP